MVFKKHAERYGKAIIGDWIILIRLYDELYQLKTFKNDESREAHYVQDLLITIHSYWLRETEFPLCHP